MSPSQGRLRRGGLSAGASQQCDSNLVICRTPVVEGNARKTPYILEDWHNKSCPPKQSASKESASKLSCLLGLVDI